MARGHTPRTQELYGTTVAHFVHWLCQEPPERQHVDTQSVRTFLQEHLPSCRCTHPGSHDLKNVRAALNQLLLMLGGDRLSESKSCRVERLPLPQTTGAALVDYLSHGRPATSSRSVFVLHRAQMGWAATNTTVRGAIRRAFERAGLPWSGTHILRHTATTRMVQGGVTLKDVADVLGHRSIDTTLIYTKVDLPQLSRVALPWPGRRP